MYQIQINETRATEIRTIEQRFLDRLEHEAIVSFNISIKKLHLGEKRTGEEIDAYD